MSDKKLRWEGSSLADLRETPEEVRSEFGFVLRAVQLGQAHQSIKSWTGAAGVYEIRVNDSDATYRTVYVVNLPDAIYVLHVFQKKSASGIKTSQRDKAMVATRLREAKRKSDEVMAARAEEEQTRQGKGQKK